MANVPFQTDLKKDFRHLLELITARDEAYDNYCALRIAQKSVLKYEADLNNLDEVTQSLEHFREYCLAVLLLDFVGVHLVSLNKVEEKIYISALNERLAKLQKQAADTKQDKEVQDKLKNEIGRIKAMLVDVKLACRD